MPKHHIHVIGIISQAPADSQFVEDHMTNGVVDSDTMYPAYRTWLNNNYQFLGALDHAMLFTGYVNQI